METEKREHKVLVIDDEPEVLEGCKELLTRKGFAVSLCADSLKAIPELKTNHYDAVLLDIRMPGMEGTDLLPLIKKIRPDLPVIVVSAYSDDPHQAYCRSLGAFEVLGKPSSPELILDAVNRAIEQREQIPLILTSLSLRSARDQVYRKVILSALRKTSWNQVKSADLLGISRYCLMRWIRKLSISY